MCVWYTRVAGLEGLVGRNTLTLSYNELAFKFGFK